MASSGAELRFVLHRSKKPDRAINKARALSGLTAESLAILGRSYLKFYFSLKRPSYFHLKNYINW